MTTSPPDDEVYAILDRLVDFPAARVDDALAFLFAALRRLVGAEAVFWNLLVRLGGGEVARVDLCRGWRVRDMVMENPSPERLARVRQYLEGTRKQDPLHLGETSINLARRAGEFRAGRMRGGLVDWERFRRTPHHAIYYGNPGIDDRMLVVCPVNVDVESCFAFDRIGHPGEAHFSETDADRTLRLLRSIRWFHRRLILSRGVPAGGTPCTPAERRALDLLLTGRSEKEIADALDLSVGTTHNRVGAVFKKFGVRSRPELMALWL